MTDIVAQASFNSGEWSPKLNARVDLAKYKSGAALLENFFIDYRGGVSSRPGSKYIIQAFKPASPVRRSTYSASATVQYVLEFGDGYIRFIFEGQPIVETGFAITAATQANPCVLTVTGNNYAIGDWIFVNGVVGMTQLNGRFFKVTAVAGAAVTLAQLNGTALNSGAYGAYSSAGLASRVYTIPSIYTQADDLRLIKFVQSINQMILCHPHHPPQVLRLVSAANWSLSPAVIGATVQPPTTVLITTTLGAGAVNYSYGVTAIDSGGQESGMSVPGGLVSKLDIRTTAGSNQIAWTASPGATAYNIYEATVSYFGAQPAGVQFGFIGTCKDVNFIDSNIGPDFSQTPPIRKNPFVSQGIESVTVTAAGAYTAMPVVTTTGGSPLTTAILSARVVGTSISLVGGGINYTPGEQVNYPGGIIIQIDTIGLFLTPTSFHVINPGSISTGSIPTNPMGQISTNGIGAGFLISATWGVSGVTINDPGGGYTSAPTIVFTPAGATATAVVAGAEVGNPSVPGFVQQRLVLAAKSTEPQTFYMSRPGEPFNFDVSSPARADDAVTGTLVSTSLQNIKSIIGSTAGMILLTDKASWLVNGGSSGSAITPASAVANPQSFIGANDVPPIVANWDILFVQAKGAAIRDLSYNIYFNVFTGTDISTLSSHLFFGFEILEWAWAEQPFYTVWAVRSDGQLLTLTFLKEQDFIGWTHSVTAGVYESVTTATEHTATAGEVDAVYTVVGRAGSKFIERFVERTFPTGVADAWCVDAGLGYSGGPRTAFSGAEHLAGLTVTGLADGVIIPPFVMAANGQFTLGTAASKVTVGVGYTCKLQTLALDVGDPSVQGKVKKINAVTVRVADTLGLSIGTNFNNQIPMKDLVRGNVSSTKTGLPSQLVTDLVTGDAETNIDPSFNIYGQYCISQTLPYPASVLGVFPAISVGEIK